MSSRRAVIALGLAVLCASATSGRVAAQDVSATEVATYQDRLIDGGALAPDVSSGTAPDHDGSGWARAFRVQAITSRVTRNDIDLDESGLHLSGMLDTLNFGAITLDANARTSNGYGDDAGNLLTVYQLGLPMDGGWRRRQPGRVQYARRGPRPHPVPVLRALDRVNNGLATEWRSPRAGCSCTRLPGNQGN